MARDFPELSLIISQLGQPFIDETICLMAKHPHVYSDISGLLSRPWQAYNALVLAHQAGVADKLLFGSDFPYTNAAHCIEALYAQDANPITTLVATEGIRALSTSLPMVVRAPAIGPSEAGPPATPALRHAHAGPPARTGAPGREGP